MEQMAIWLQRQEAMFLHTAYLTWLHPQAVINMDDDNVTTDDGKEEDDMKPEPLALNSTPKYWYIAKRPLFRNVTINYLESHHVALDFLTVFSDFLKKHVSRAPHPSKHDHFDVYKQVHVILPANHFLDSKQIIDRICTTPARDASGRQSSVPAHFDTAFVIEDPVVYKEDSFPQGLFVFFAFRKGSHFNC
jgi:hypothetical protein